MSVLVLAAVSCAQNRSTPPPAPPRPIEYTVGLRDAHAQMVDVSMLIRSVQPGEFEIALPVWRPGRYALVEPVTTLRDVSARSGSGIPLEMRKQDKSSWIITIPGNGDGGGGELIVSYRVYANSIADRTRHADDTHAFLSPATVFMYAPSLRHAPLSVRIDAPAPYQQDWRIATGLEPDPSNPGTVLAPNYDVLVDSPLEIGLHEVLTFEVEGKPHEIVIWNPTPLARTLSAERITGDFERVVRTQLEIFGRLPYQRYVFLVHCYPTGSGGTEHLNSTIMGCRPDAFRESAAFERFLRLVAHEYFHTWNVKQFRPAGIHPYDYQKENYSGLFWVAEGATSYYDKLTMVRAGLTPPDEYLRTMSTSIDTVLRRPGASVQSLEESSFDAWVKFNKTWPDSINTTVSFYDKGSHANFLLDLIIRRGSNNEHSLDDVMRDMFERFPLDGPGYTTADYCASIERFAGTDVEDFFTRHIAGTVPLPFEDLVGVAGLELVRTGGDSARAYLGLNLQASDGFTSVTTVLDDGPAHAAGLIAGDIVVSANGQRLRNQAELDAVVRALNPGDELVFSTFRYDAQREIRLTLGERPEGRWTLRRVADPTEEQKAVYRSWLQQPWPGDESAGRRPQRRSR